MPLAELLRRRLRAARDFDARALVLRDLRWLDVFTCELVSRVRCWAPLDRLDRP